MKNYAVVVSLAMLTVAGCKSGSEPVVQHVEVKAVPQFDWKQYDVKTVEVKPSQTATFAVPADTTRLRVVLTADVSVDAGVMTKSKFQGMNGNMQDYVGSTTFSDLPCALVAATRDDARCSVDPQQPSVFVVHDPRAANSDPAAQILGKTPAATSSDQGVPPNKVTLTFYQWACSANCAATPAQ